MCLLAATAGGGGGSVNPSPLMARMSDSIVSVICGPVAAAAAAGGEMSVIRMLSARCEIYSCICCCCCTGLWMHTDALGSGDALVPQNQMLFAAAPPPPLVRWAAGDAGGEGGGGGVTGAGEDGGVVEDIMAMRAADTLSVRRTRLRQSRYTARLTLGHELGYSVGVWVSVWRNSLNSAVGSCCWDVLAVMSRCSEGGDAQKRNSVTTPRRSTKFAGACQI